MHFQIKNTPPLSSSWRVFLTHLNLSSCTEFSVVWLWSFALCGCMMCVNTEGYQGHTGDL